MMISSRAATRDFTPNPLRSPAYMDGREWNWNRTFGHYSLGMGGLGVMTEADAIAILGGAQQATATEAQKKEAYEAYYGKTGFYSQKASVQAAAAAAVGSGEAAAPLPDGPPAPMLYAAMMCGAQEMSGGACVSQNQAVQTANMVLQENARRAWDLRVCVHNAAINPGTDIPCDRYRGESPVPAVPNGVKQQAVCSGGECFTPLIGSTPTEVPNPNTPAPQVVPPTPQQQASYISGKANQSIPPKGQPGEVPKDGGAGTGGGGGTGDGTETAGGGKIFGMDPLMLAVVAGVALLALRK